MINIKEKFINHFVNLGYHYFNDESILPTSDSEDIHNRQESLFVGAGVYKFKDYFTNKLKSDKDYVSIQPCIRLDDINFVGDNTHLTSFLMGGIFSFGFHPQHEILYSIFEFIYHLIPNVSINDFIITIHPSLSYLKSVWESYDINLKTRFEEANEWKAPGIQGYSTEIMLLSSKQEEIELGNIVLVPMPDGKIFYDVGLGLERISFYADNTNLGYGKKYFDLLKQQITKNNINIDINSETFQKLNDYLHTIDLIIKEGIQPGNRKHGYVLRNLIRRCLIILHQNKLSFKSFLLDITLLFFEEEQNKIYIILKEAKKYLHKHTNYIQTNKISKNDYNYLLTTIGCSQEMIETFNKYLQ